MTIRIFNTASMQKEELVPLEPGRVGLYVCGPTVYNLIHVGNARTFTSFDVVVRYLRYRGLQVRYVRNYTDVDDKIIQAAAREGTSAQALSERYIQAFREDVARLGLLEPDISPRVTDHMPEILGMVERLVERGIAYVSSGDVYFSVERYPGYARLSGRDVTELRVGERAETGDKKRAPLDFALWKAAKPGEPAWDSPWGKGRPGWHIECSAMSARYLGETFDIHGGALDLIFPHHENELAQSEAASGKPFVRSWMHCGFLNMEDVKMSKSLGNMVLLREALTQLDAEALRLFFLSTHYRNPLAFSERSLADAEARVEYFYETLARVDERLLGAEADEGPVHGDPAALLRDFEEAMDDDFNCPGALAAVAALFSGINELLDKPPIKDRALVRRTLFALRALARRISPVLGLFGEEPAAWLARHRDRRVSQRGLDAAEIERLIAERAAARKERRFADADAVRERLTALSIELRDGPAGTTWKVTG